MGEIEVKFYEVGEVEDELLRFAVIAARFKGRWIFCKHRQRETFEIPGGHREAGENLFDTANRELREETGAVEFELSQICVYSVVRDGVESMGGLFFAEILKLGELDSSFEIEKITFMDCLPDNLTYPKIQPFLYRRVQMWLNLQSAKDELWDVYDENRVLTGRTHRRGDSLKKGDYHLVVHIWIQNSKGEFLITKRAPNKGYPNMWECTGGSAIAGDDSLTAAMREVKEETGLNLAPENGEVVVSYRRAEDDFVDVWLFRQDFNLWDVVLQENETVDAMYATESKIFEMIENGQFMPFSYIDRFFELLKMEGK